jgi:hypothetical protein
MIMKSIIKYTFIVASVFAFAACTDNFEKDNTNPYEATDDMLQTDNLTVGSFFSQMELRMVPFTAGGQQDDSYGSTGSYQHFEGLCSDWYSGYVAPTGTWANGNHNGNYYFTGTWGNSMYSQNYTQIMPAWSKVKVNAEKNNTPQVTALATVVKVYAMHRVTDQYGPIPYVNYVAGSINNAFNSQEDVYKKFFNELDSAIDVLTPFASSGTKILEKFDYIYQGNSKKWAKFANTLRLRLALRVVYADPSLAQQEAEKSFSSTVGFLEDANDRATISGVTIMNPLWEQAYSWNEERMSSSMDAYMNGYNDPRLSKYFVAAKGDSKYHGIRLGINMASGNADYIGDKISNFNISSTSTIPYMSAAESYFLRAEAALRGWNAGGTAKDFYEKGIKVSMAEWGVTSGVEAYIASTAQPVAFVDNTGKGGDAAQPSTITVAYDEKASFEQNLERIITQKWIANFRISPEGWAEFRRTGYPKLFPTTRNSNAGTINTNLQIRRMPYPSTLYDNNSAAVQEAVKLLGGGDNGGTKLWWDKNPNH